MSWDQYTLAALHGTPVPGFVVDIHAHLGENVQFHIVHHRDLGLYVREMDRHGVDVAGVSCIPAAIGGLQQGGNAMVLEAVEGYPERFFGWMSVNPHYAESILPELERCHAAGCRGVKIHNSVGLPYEHPNYTALYEFADERALPILAHTWGGSVEKMRPSFERYSRVKWSLAHAGSAEPEVYVKVARAHPNVYLDICFSRSPRGLVEWFIEQGVVERLMFSSDNYFMGLAQQLGRVLFADITPEHRALVLGENARGFMEWSERASPG